MIPITNNFGNEQSRRQDFGGMGDPVNTLSMTVIYMTLAIGLCCRTSARQSKDEETIREIDAAWSEALKNKDLDKVMENYAEDASFLAPDEPIVRGRGKICEWFKKRIALPGYSASFTPSTIVVSRSKDIAYEIGTFRATINDETGKPLVYSGKHLVVWKKHDGYWKVVAESINRDSATGAQQ